MLDRVVLGVQWCLDRFIRGFRLNPGSTRDDRRVLIIQIDGLSRAVLEQGFAQGHMPYLRGLLRGGGFTLKPMSVGIPTSTPAFQMAAMYGVPADIPGFHYHDKRRRSDVHFPRAGHAAQVETEQAGGRVGILTGGSVYGCVFTGGAENKLFSFAELKRPSGPGVTRVLSGGIVLAWVTLKSLVLTIAEVFSSAVRMAAHPADARAEWDWLKIRIGISVWIRELFTLAVARDLYGGVPAIYVNYLDYDVAAHTFGPASKQALRALRWVDGAIQQLARILRRVPEHRYDLYVLSDHGQALSRPYATLTGGQPLERLIFEEFLDPRAGPRPTPAATRPGYPHGFRAYRIGERGMAERLFHYLDRTPGSEREADEAEAHEEGGVRVISAGPNAFLYVVDTEAPLAIEQLEKRFPGLARALSTSRGVGFVLSRSADGPVCFWRGGRFLLGRGEAGPFAQREDCAVVVRGLVDLMAMPSAGDLVIYGTGAPEGNISFIPERGAHAGPAPEELHTFIVHPEAVHLPAAITHPLELYGHFIRYHRARASGADALLLAQQPAAKVSRPADSRRSIPRA
jgi:hypothetical protein